MSVIMQIDCCKLSLKLAKLSQLRTLASFFYHQFDYQFKCAQIDDALGTVSVPN